MKWFKPGYIFLAAFAALYLYAWWRNRGFERAARPSCYYMKPDRRDYLPGADGDARFQAAMKEFERLTS